MWEETEYPEETQADTGITHKLHTQTPHTNSTHKLHTQTPHTNSTHKLHTQTPHTNSTHKLHTQTPHTNSAAGIRYTLHHWAACVFLIFCEAIWHLMFPNIHIWQFRFYGRRRIHVHPHTHTHTLTHSDNCAHARTHTYSFWKESEKWVGGGMVMSRLLKVQYDRNRLCRACASEQGRMSGAVICATLITPTIVMLVCCFFFFFFCMVWSGVRAFKTRITSGLFYWKVVFVPC